MDGEDESSNMDGWATSEGTKQTTGNSDHCSAGTAAETMLQWCTCSTNVTLLRKVIWHVGVSGGTVPGIRPICGIWISVFEILPRDSE